jgi:hypothetical protein
LTSWQARIAIILTGANYESIEILRNDRKFCYASDVDALKYVFPELGNYFRNLPSLRFSRSDDASGVKPLILNLATLNLADTFILTEELTLVFS